MIDNTIETTIQRIRRGLDVGASLDDIRQTLISEGIDEYSIFLAFKAAEILNSDN